MFETNNCPICNETHTRLAKHISDKHPDEFERQNQLVLKYYNDGLSARKIAALPDIMYTGGTSVVRVLNKYFTKDELESGRKERIAATIDQDYADGKRDWINAINAERVKTEEARKKNSEGLKKAYAEGRKQKWPYDKSKSELDEMYTRVSQTLQDKAAKGELTTLMKSGPENPKWKTDRAKVARYWRKHEDFQKADRKKILARAEYKCQQCGITAEELAIKAAEGNLNRCMLECDHIIPIHKYGKRDWESNGQALCSFCHINKTLVEMKEMEEMERAGQVIELG